MALSNVPLQQLAPSRLFRSFETASVCTCVGLIAWLGCEVALGLVNNRPGWLLIVGVVAAAYLLADLLAGLVHFAGDSFGTVDTPMVGLTFVLPLRLHHVHPEQICQNDFVATNGNNAFATLFVLAPLLLLVSVQQDAPSTLLGLFVWALSSALLLTNQIHKWAHVADAPTIVRGLQRAGVLLSPDRHAVHHRPPYVGGYCVTSGLCNRVLDPIGFFPFLERVIRIALCLPRTKT